MRHEALVFRMGVKDHPSFRRRSDGMKLEEVRSGDRRGGREQPRRSCVGPELPDGSGAVSETGRYMRRTGYVTPLDSSPALTRWIRAGSRRAPAHHCWAGELQVWSRRLGLGGHGEWSTTVAVAIRRGRAGCLTRRPDASERGNHSRTFHRCSSARGDGQWIGAMPAEGVGGAESP